MERLVSLTPLSIFSSWVSLTFCSSSVFLYAASAVINCDWYIAYLSRETLHAPVPFCDLVGQLVDLLLVDPDDAVLGLQHALERLLRLPIAHLVVAIIARPVEILVRLAIAPHTLRTLVAHTLPTHPTTHPYLYIPVVAFGEEGELLAAEFADIGVDPSGLSFDLKGLRELIEILLCIGHI
jgi:hypothetical protein